MLPIALIGGVILGIRVEAQPFRDAWLMTYGHHATAVVEAISPPCSERDTSFEISFTGPGGTREIMHTADVAGCPKTHSIIQVMYDPANPGHVGDLRVLKNTPADLLTPSLTVAFAATMMNYALQIWRDPTLIWAATRRRITNRSA
jgi:hypothetical protein